MVINNGKNSHQVTSVCHCITRNDQMYVVHIGSNDIHIEVT
jgi:hypothetical protein